MMPNNVIGGGGCRSRRNRRAVTVTANTNTTAPGPSTASTAPLGRRRRRRGRSSSRRHLHPLLLLLLALSSSSSRVAVSVVFFVVTVVVVSPPAGVATGIDLRRILSRRDGRGRGERGDDDDDDGDDVETKTGTAGGEAAAAIAESTGPEGSTTTTTTTMTDEESTSASSSSSSKEREKIGTTAHHRELERAISRLSEDLAACTSRSEAARVGFRNLYRAHLASIDAARKCGGGGGGGAAGGGTASSFPNSSDLDDGNNDDMNDDAVIDADLIEEARAYEDMRVIRDRLRGIITSRDGEIRELRDVVDVLVRRERTWERTTSELVSRLEIMKKREGAWERTITELAGDVYDRVRREGEWRVTRSRLEDDVRRISRDAAGGRFGPGPHFVSMIVVLDDDEDDDDVDGGGGDGGREREIIFQLAPLDAMPHSVYLFLSQIAGGYWNRGTSAFVINAGHVLQACPHPCLEYEDLGGDMSGYPYIDMKRDGLDVVSYQEYSTMYPHLRYTIGYAGRPRSGPEFYINLMDNTLDHGTREEREFRMGPRGHAAWAKEAFGGGGGGGEGGRGDDAAGGDHIEPYPCFGKVIRGFDVVDEIAKGMTRALLPKGNDGGEGGGARGLDDNILLRPVKIVSVAILENYDPKGSGNGSDEKEEDEGRLKEDEDINDEL